MTLLGIKREFKPEAPEAAQSLDAKAEDNYFTAKEIAEAASLPIHLFRDQAERNRKRVPHLMLVGNLRFSLPAILEWEMANSVVGSAAAAVTEEAESPESRSRAPDQAKKQTDGPQTRVNARLRALNAQEGRREQREKNARMRAWNDDFRRAVLKRARPETAPTLGERAKKSQPDKGWDFTLWWGGGN